MGLGGISIWQLLIILAIVLLIFGTKRLKNLGSDMGGAIKGFKDAVSDGEEAQNKVEDDNSTAEMNQQKTSEAATEDSKDKV